LIVGLCMAANIAHGIQKARYREVNKNTKEGKSWTR